jgi:hypothetical protein
MEKEAGRNGLKRKVGGFLWHEPRPAGQSINAPHSLDDD